MPRAKVILQSEFPYNITGRCINKEWFEVPMPDVWSIFCENLLKVHKEKGMLIHSFILMSNHFHLIATTPEANVSECMHQFMRRTSSDLTKAGNRINQTFAGRHYKCILQSQQYFLNAYKYNYRNPVTAGICSDVESYPYSSLQFLLGQTPKFPLLYDQTFHSDRAGILKWLNTAPDPEKLEGVRYGLKHQYFKSKTGSKVRKMMIEDSDLL